MSFFFVRFFCSKRGGGERKGGCMNSGEVFSLSLHAMLVVCVAARVVHFLSDVFNPSSSVYGLFGKGVCLLFRS